ncbi:Pyruvate phosphate dikinase, PEP/pyruvate binding domain [Fibrobacter sp. UWH5]|nr:Pyruvate phosphate dikinase, PEP/pyruvate binding domain [Fibrobacter sp. UWH5]
MILLKSALVILMINLKKYRNCFMATLSAVAFFSACSDDSSSSSVNEEFSGLHINASGAKLESFFVGVDEQQILCPGSDSDNLKCTSSGVSISFDVGDSADVVVKAWGNEFFAGKLGADKDRNIDVSLSRLDEFKNTADEASGFTADEGYDAFLKKAYKSSTEIGRSYLVKFIITDFDSKKPVLHLQNTGKHSLHYEFAKKVLKDSRSLSEFESDVYYSTKKKTVAGTLVYYAAQDSMIALTFFPTDKISAELVAKTHRIIESRLQFLNVGTKKNRLYYMPSGSVAESAAEDYADEFKRLDVPVYTHAQIFGDVSLQIMNTGVAYGTLRKFTADELDTAIVSSHDILILETLPAEIPLVAGAISKDAQTPLSHVNLAAKARKTPNIAFNGHELPDSLLALCDSLVKLTVSTTSYTVEKTTLKEAKEYWESLKKEKTILSYDLSEKGFPDFKDLGFNSAGFVGVKAANLAELQKFIPENSPDGFAVPFYHYDNFMSYAQVTESLCLRSQKDCKKEGRSSEICDYIETLCESAVKDDSLPLKKYIAAVTADEKFESDTRTREAVLDNIRYMIRHIPVDEKFGTELDEKVYKIFGETPVRLRSSTNSEDLDEFNGAGLYKSVKATREPKDLPSDEIRKVWASVWSFKAYEERTLWNIDHFSVQMAVAVHGAFIDEAANGVIVTQNIADFSVAGIYVNVQKGEVSITNPENNSRPEIFSIVPAAKGVQKVLLQSSTLSPDEPVLTDSEVTELYGFVEKIQTHFAKLYKKSADELILDIEFKVMGDERELMFKQARPYIL